MKKDIVLFGIQGSGKGTQATLLMEKLQGYKYLEMGNVFRAIRSNENILSVYMKDTMDKGGMLDDALAFGIFDMAQKILKDDEYLLVDGFMRTAAQMHYFCTQEYVNKRDFIAIHYKLSKEHALERVMSRAQTQGRADDTPEAIAKRFALYEKETQPVIDTLDGLGKVIHINANQPIEAILQDTVDVLDDLGIL